MWIGGDWYDAICLPGGAVALVIGDVQGQQVPAASLMGKLRTAVRAYACEGHGPAACADTDQPAARRIRTIRTGPCSPPAAIWRRPRQGRSKPAQRAIRHLPWSLQVSHRASSTSPAAFRWVSTAGPVRDQADTNPPWQRAGGHDRRSSGSRQRETSTRASKHSWRAWKEPRRPTSRSWRRSPSPGYGGPPATANDIALLLARLNASLQRNAGRPALHVHRAPLTSDAHCVHRDRPGLAAVVPPSTCAQGLLPGRHALRRAQAACDADHRRTRAVQAEVVQRLRWLFSTSPATPTPPSVRRCCGAARRTSRPESASSPATGRGGQRVPNKAAAVRAVLTCDRLTS